MPPEPVSQLPGLLVGGTLLGAVAAPLTQWCGLRFEWPAFGLPLAAGWSSPAFVDT